MFDETLVPTVPEDSSCPERGDPEPPTETLNSNLPAEPSPAAGKNDGGAPTPDPPQSSGENRNAENEIAPPATASARKIAANRENATHSTGPTTDEGKAASSRNAITHGFFAGKLFALTPAGAAEHQEFAELGAQLLAHYKPTGFKEEWLVEQIFTELVRQGRILRYEEMVLSKDGAFFTTPAPERVLRYTTTHSREMSRLVKELEDEQAKRQTRARAESKDPPLE